MYKIVIENNTDEVLGWGFKTDKEAHRRMLQIIYHCLLPPKDRGKELTVVEY